MTTLKVYPAANPLRGTARVPGDKSISHRALLFGALAEGETRAEGWLPAEDCLATIRVLRALGVEIAHEEPTTVRVQGVGLRNLREPADVLDCGGSGTTMRLLAGILAGQPFTSVLTGNPALRRRPMDRIAKPLRAMGATILSREMDGREKAPLSIRGGGLRAIEYVLPIASAQVKSAVLLAGLFADGETSVREPGPARDHTERLLSAMGVPVDREGARISIRPPQAPLRPLRDEKGGPYRIPADISSAAFLLVAGSIVPDSAVILPEVGVNETRTGVLDVLKSMQADISSANLRSESVEPVADLEVRGTELQAVDVDGDIVVRTIDEFPILAVAATQAEGRTQVRGASELRVKESDRIASVATELRKMGADVVEAPDGFTIAGPARLRGAIVDSHMDHRLAMALAVAGLVADGPTTIRNAEVIHDSFPGFVELMNSIGAEMVWIADE